MRYNRKTLCLLAGIQIEHFKEAARVDPETGDDNLPIVARDEGRGGSHAKYSELDVFAVAAAVQLAAGGGFVSKGMSFASAAKIVAATIGTLPDAVRLSRAGKGAHFIGYVSLSDGGGFNVSDTLGKIALKVAADYNGDAMNIYLASLATVAMAIEGRAEEAGVEWATERLWAAE